MQENIYSQRGGRYVIPVKREYHKQIKGSVLDQSTSGQTVFIEPDEIASMQIELDLLLGEEAREEAVILSMLTSMVEQEQTALRLNIEVTGTYDFIFAKAKYARTLGASEVTLNDRGFLRMNGGRHPMLQGMIPISLEIGKGYKSPNHYRSKYRRENGGAQDPRAADPHGSIGVVDSGRGGE